MPIQTPIAGSESGDNIRSEVTISDGGVLSNNPEAQSDVGFGSFAVAKDTGYTSNKDGKDLFTDEDRAVVVKTENASGEVISLELTVIDGMGGEGKHGDGQIAANILAGRFEDGGDFKVIVDKAQADLDSSLKISPGAGALFVSFRLKHDSSKDEDLADIALVGDCRLVIWDENGNKVFATKDESLVQIWVDQGKITAEEALNHRRRNVTGNALGKGSPADFTQIYRDVVIKPGYTVELCSDGRTDNFTDEEEWENIKGKNSHDAATASFNAVRGRKDRDKASRIIKPKVDNVTVLIYKHKGKEGKVEKEEGEAVAGLVKAVASDVEAAVDEIAAPVITGPSVVDAPDKSTPPTPLDLPPVSDADFDDVPKYLQFLSAEERAKFNGKGIYTLKDREEEGDFLNGVLQNGTIVYPGGRIDFYVNGVNTSLSAAPDKVLKVKDRSVVPAMLVVPPAASPSTPENLIPVIDLSTVSSVYVPVAAPAIAAVPAPVQPTTPVKRSDVSLIGQTAKGVALAGAIAAGAVGGAGVIGAGAYGVSKFADAVNAPESHEVTVDTIKGTRKAISDELRNPNLSVEKLRSLVVEAKYQITNADGPEELKWAKPLNLIVTGKQVQSILAEQLVIPEPVIPEAIEPEKVGTSAPATTTDKITE